MSREVVKGTSFEKSNLNRKKYKSYFGFNDFKAGMMVILNNNMRMLVFEQEDGGKFFQGAPGWMNITQYNASLECTEVASNEYDIKTIYSLPSCPYGDINDIFDKPEKSRKILWEREKNEEA